MNKPMTYKGYTAKIGLNTVTKTNVLLAVFPAFAVS